MRKHAFTLIELLVVIAIISILSAVAITSFENVRNDTRITLANAQMQEIAKFIEVARLTTGKTLFEVTDNGYSMQFCVSAGVPLNTLQDSHNCIIKMTESFQDIANAIPDQTVMNYFRDPWGSPYLWDENEGEQIANPCRAEQITSVGPDALWGTSDDLYVSIPFFTIACASS